MQDTQDTRDASPARTTSDVDPVARQFLDWLSSLNRPNVEDLEPHEARSLSNAFLKNCAGAGEPVASVEDRTITGPRGPIRLRLYRPAGSPPFGTLVYFHGGGYVYGSIETHDAACRRLANEAPCIVVSVDYALAPEFKVPAPFEDALAATDWVVANAAAFGGDPSGIAVGGDSAGGSLAAQVCLAARDRGTPSIAFQLLVYPGLDVDDTRRSYQDYGDGFLLTTAKIRWFLSHYLARPEDIDRPYVCPLRADSLAALPPALIIVAQCDPLRDDGIAYAQRLNEHGVAAVVAQYDGQIHGFFSMLATFPTARVAIAEAARHLRAVFGVRGLASDPVASGAAHTAE